MRLAANSNLAWIVRGDFNEILTGEEKICGVPREANLINMFRNALLDCSLSDVGFIGDKFTWTNNRQAPEL